MRISVRLFFITFLLFFSLLSLPKPTVFAQTEETNQVPQAQYMVPDNNSDVPKNLHTYTQSAMIEIMASILCQITGKDPINPNQKCLGVDVKNGKIGFVENNGGLIGFQTKMIVSLYTIPVRTGDFANYLAGNFGVAKPTYAQTTGLGFNSLSPLINLWAVFRNVVYLIFVFVFIIIGAAVMLRVRIDPRTVMTIQNQIPKLVIGLLLITFSFAIAGFMIDIMYALSYLSISLIASADPGGLPSDIAIKLMSAGNPLNAINVATGGPTGGIGLFGIVNNSSAAVGGFLGPIFSTTPGWALMTAIMGILGATVGSNLGGVIGTIIGGIAAAVLIIGTGGLALPAVLGIFAAGTTIGGTAGSIIAGTAGALLGATQAENLAAGFFSIVAWLIIAIAILFSLIRLWFQLILAYINIFLDVVFAPFWIVAGLVPGSKINFSAWFRDLAANLVAFPAALIMFLLAKVFMDAFGASQGQDIFVAPLIGNPSQFNEIGAIIGLGIILSTPEVVKIAKNVLKAPGLPSSGIGTQLGTGKAIVAGAAGGAISRTFKFNPNTGDAVGPGAKMLVNQKRRASTFILGLRAKKPADVIKETTPPSTATKE